MAICIYEHDAATIIPALISELPYSTTLLRRIQHGIAYPYETAYILANFPPGSTPEPGQPWLAARVDLFGGRTTQMLIYSSLEAEHTSIPPIVTVSDTKTAAPEILNVDSTRSNNNRNNTNDNDDDDPVINTNKPIVSTFSASPSVLALARSQLLALLSYVKVNLLPPYLSYLAQAAKATSAEAGNTSVDLAITLNLTQYPISGSIASTIPPYYKYFFRRFDFSPDEASGRSADLPFADLSLPAGYRFHDREGREGVLSKHLDLVQSRTHIPRPRTQLSTMPGVAVYSDSGSSDADEMPIAWGFLGVDGALATLHVEPEHRGRGLAVPLSKAIMRRGMSVDGVFGAGSVNSEDSQTRERVGAWAHAEVAGYNNASRRVMEKIGGQVLTTVTWTVIELLD
ncbi:Acyl-CoA N-acyltransferase [Penicillium chrysogenum]|uniref:Acyl-CoA N-acyltransferase n=1 Tax=Penicillium chrysogenum TaxID=5076 RepID=A0ABQ8WM96_PENCH|nr:Acyl-CoA N-acyltransferase [Penicillium chrysogenum]